MAYGIKDFNTILTDIITTIMLESINVTDFSPGSVMRSFSEGVAVAIENFYVSTYVGFKDYLQNIQDFVFEYPQLVGVKAVSDVVFSRAGSSGEKTIPLGTSVQTTTGLVFKTTAETAIPDAASVSPSVEVEAEEVGFKYNVGSGTIVVIADNVNGVETVTNALAATSGTDAESPTAYKARFQEYVEGLAKSNLSGIKEGALSIEGITSVSVVEHFPPVADVNTHVYIDDSTASGVSTAKVVETQALIDGDGTEENPGYRSAGVNVIVAKPTIATQNITAIVYTLADVDPDTVESQVIDAVTYYVNRLGVGDDIIYQEIVSAIMSVFGVVDVTLSLPSANVVIASTTVGRIGVFTITVQEV